MHGARPETSEKQSEKCANGVFYSREYRLIGAEKGTFPNNTLMARRHSWDLSQAEFNRQKDKTKMSLEPLTKIKHSLTIVKFEVGSREGLNTHISHATFEP